MFLRAVRRLQRGARRLFALEQFSDEPAARMTGRTELSLALVKERRPRGVLLNVGSSTGWLEHALATDDTLRVVAVDHDEASVAAARRHAPTSDIRHASVLALPFPNDSFDAATMFEVIEHVPNGSELRALREILRVLKPGAWFLLSAPHDHPVANLLDPAWYLGHRHYSHAALVATVLAAGFTVDDTYRRGGLADALSMSALYAFKAIFDAEFPLHRSAERSRRAEYFPANAAHGWTQVFVVARKPAA